MKSISHYFVILFVIASVACTMQKECGAFNDDDLELIPYKVGDTLTFQNQSGELLNIYIGHFEKSEAYGFDCTDRYGVCACTNYVEVYSTDTRTATPYAFLRLEQSDASDVQYFKYQVIDFNFEFDFRNELQHIKDFEHAELLDSAEISNKIYTEVVVISNLNNFTSDIAKVYFNKEDGILQFSEKSSHNIWSLVD